MSTGCPPVAPADDDDRSAVMRDIAGRRDPPLSPLSSSDNNPLPSPSSSTNDDTPLIFRSSRRRSPMIGAVVLLAFNASTQDGDGAIHLHTTRRGRGVSANSSSRLSALSPIPRRIVPSPSTSSTGDNDVGATATRNPDNAAHNNDSTNEEYSPPLMSDFPLTPPQISSSIKDFLAGGHGISSPRQYQVDTIFHIAFRKPTFTYLIIQPGEG